MFGKAFGSDHRYCDGVSRRRMLTLGATRLLGGLTLPTLLQLQAQAATTFAPKAKACIFFLLEGGPSHIDMWDMKPDAPKEIRGPFNPISTVVPGTQISQLMPMCAQIADKYTILRSHSHADNAHQTGRHWLLTGYPPNFADGQAKGVPFNELYPSLGSIVSRELGPGGEVPPYIELPNPLGPGGPGFYGAAYAPFTINNDPSQPDFKVQDLDAPASVSSERFARRRKLLAEAEALGAANLPGAGPAQKLTAFYEKAMEIVTSPKARAAFNLAAESSETRTRYGYSSIGQSALLARRLVEGGSRFIGIEHGSWDTHFDNFTSHEKALCPPTDRAFSALISDLDERGLLDETLVVMMGEMGRTPQINNLGGRDHWGRAWSMAMAGCGLKPGVVYGSTNDTGTEVKDNPVKLGDLFHTYLRALSIDSGMMYEIGGQSNPVADPAAKSIDVLLA